MQRFPLATGVFKNLETLTSNEGLRALLNKLAANFGWPDSRWEDLRTALTAGTTGSVNPPTLTKFKDNGAGSTGVFTWAFAYQSNVINEEQMWLAIQIPHAYRRATDVHPHLHWGLVTAGAAGQFVRWGLEYTWVDIGGDFLDTQIIHVDASSAATATVQGDGTLATGRHYMSLFPTIDGSSILGVSSMMLCRLFRNSSHGDDTLNQAAVGLEFDLHFEKDSIGSRLEYVK